jgi:hypothetical protein
LTPNVSGAAAAGYWPAFWALGAAARPVGATNWPSIGEIDVMEDINGRSSEFATLHCGSNPDGPCHETTGISSGERACGGCQTGFHQYAVEYDRSVSPVGGGFPAAFGGGPTGATQPGVPMLVDYVRVLTSGGGTGPRYGSRSPRGRCTTRSPTGASTTPAGPRPRGTRCRSGTAPAVPTSSGTCPPDNRARTRPAVDTPAGSRRPFGGALTVSSPKS